MSDPAQIARLLDRFKRMAPLMREVWQGGVARMPAWIGPEDGREPFRPLGALWLSVSTGRIGVHLQSDDRQRAGELVLEGLLRFAKQEEKWLNGRAARLQVADLGTREWLEQSIADDVHVEVVPRLEAWDAALREYTRLVQEDTEQPPSILQGEGVTVDAVRRFADAAARYYAAAPWQQAFEGTPIARSILFDAADGIPFDDHDLWLNHQLPLAGPRAFPFPAHYVGRGECERPGCAELEFAEGVLRALAETTEEEMDRRWTKTVAAGGRKTKVRLALPGLLDPGQPGALAGVEAGRRSFERTHAELQRFLESHEFASLEDANAAIAETFVGRSIDERPSTASTPAERARDLAYQAYDGANGDGDPRQQAREAAAAREEVAEAAPAIASRASVARGAAPPLLIPSSTPPR